jgi:predicted dehydrogenase
MTQPLRVALVGAGGIGEPRARAVAQTPGLQLLVVADLAKERAERLAGLYDAQATTEPEAAATRPDVDLVIISTPPNSHVSLALVAINAGKHVLIEKPLAHTLSDAERICAAAEAKGVLVKTGFNHRYFPSMDFAKRLIDSGKIGDVISVEAFAGHPGGKEFGHDWIHEGSVTGGGSLVDNGIHILDLTRFFLGDVESGQGYIANLIWPFKDAEDNGFALFRSKDGKIARVHSSWTHWRGYQFWVEVTGSRGYVRAFYPPMWAEWGTTPEPGIRSKRHFEIFPAFQIQERLRGWQWTIVESFIREQSEFLAGIRAGRPTPATGRDGLRAMQMAHAIYQSSREGRAVVV